MTISEFVVDEEVSADEARVRQDLAACYRLVAHFGWDDLIATHISARVPGTEDFLINPYGLVFEEITASSLVKVNLEGQVLSSNGYDVNPAGFIIHSAVHAVRPDAGCVVHLHGRDGVAISVLEEGLLPLTQTAMMIIDDIAFHEYEGVALNPEERVRLQADLGQKNIMILRNHGSLTLGNTVASAFLRAYWFEWCSKVQLAATASGAQLRQPPPDALTATRLQTEHLSIERFAKERVWDAMLRKLDRGDPRFRA